ncbi:MAG: hypothetical protein LBK46_04705 [Oscillospiraceae bacterium]|jgi:hypothetical protein|nr:hypothetical protein [Oscillospiraceae bacterium]
MEAAWGPFDGWTIEQKAWFSQLRVEMGVQGVDHDLYLMPEGKVNEAQAVAIARRELASGYGVDESVLDGYVIKTSFLIPGSLPEDRDGQPYWAVTVAPPEGYAPPEYTPVIIMTVYVHPETGELRDSVESRLAHRNAIEPPRQDALNVAARELIEQADYMPLWGRTLEQQAEFTAKVKPLVDAMLAIGDLSAVTYDGEVDYSIIAEATYVFGLPSSKDISEEVAASIAIEEFDAREAYDYRTLEGALKPYK